MSVLSLSHHMHMSLLCLYSSFAGIFLCLLFVPLWPFLLFFPYSLRSAECLFSPLLLLCRTSLCVSEGYIGLWLNANLLLLHQFLKTRYTLLSFRMFRLKIDTFYYFFSFKSIWFVDSSIYVCWNPVFLVLLWKLSLCRFLVFMRTVFFFFLAFV